MSGNSGDAAAIPAERIRIGLMGASHAHAPGKLKVLQGSADYGSSAYGFFHRDFFAFDKEKYRMLTVYVQELSAES